MWLLDSFVLISIILGICGLSLLVFLGTFLGIKHMINNNTIAQLLQYKSRVIQRINTASQNFRVPSNSLDVDVSLSKVATSSSYAGEYRNLTTALMKNGWAAVSYIVFTTFIIYSLGSNTNLITIFVAIQIPTILASTFVTSPNPNLAYRLPFNWILTAILAIAVYSAINDVALDQDTAANTIGVILWLFTFYWIALAIRWTLQTRRKIQEYQGFSLLKLGLDMLATWGATLQIAFFISVAMLPYLESLASSGALGSLLVGFLEIILSISLLQFLPLGLVLFSLLMLVSLRLTAFPYKLKRLESLLARVENETIRAFALAVLLPIWLVQLILGFMLHLSTLFLKELKEFLEDFLARFTFVFLGLILGPSLLYLGHFSLLIAIEYAMNSPSNFSLSVENLFSLQVFSGIPGFLVAHTYILLGLLAYVIVAAPLSARYKGQSIQNLLTELKKDFKTEGFEAVTVIGHSFALFGLVPFAIVVAAFLLPGGKEIDSFSFYYGLIIATIGILAFVLMYRTSDNIDDDQQITE